jgi:hypothetical protein
MQMVNMWFFRRERNSQAVLPQENQSFGHMTNKLELDRCPFTRDGFVKE